MDIQAFVREIEKKYGKGSFIGAAVFRVEIDAIPTGALGLDLASGIGGIPVGRVTEIYGPESSGKTSLVWAIIGETNRQGKLAAIIDAEHAIDMEWAKKFGVNPDLLWINQPDDAEQWLNILDDCVRSGLFAVVALDSVAMLASKKELEGEIGDSTVGVVARLMGQSMRSIITAAAKTETALIFVNQICEKFGTHISPEKTSTVKLYMKVLTDPDASVSRIPLRRT